MFQGINVFKLIIYSLYTINVLSNSALIFVDFYKPDNQALALTIFVVALLVLIIGPTYYIAKIGWLKK